MAAERFFLKTVTLSDHDQIQVATGYNDSAAYVTEQVF